jgi:bifunctional enzyme CysN/CysC
VSPFAVDRDHAREVIGDEQFIEVWVKTSAEVCAQRDPKGLYKKAAAGNLPNLTGVGQEYEPPTGEALILDGTDAVDANAKRLLEELL